MFNLLPSSKPIKFSELHTKELSKRRNSWIERISNKSRNSELKWNLWELESWLSLKDRPDLPTEDALLLSVDQDVKLPTGAWEPSREELLCKKDALWQMPSVRLEPTLGLTRNLEDLRPKKLRSRPSLVPLAVPTPLTLLWSKKLSSRCLLSKLILASNEE